MNFGLCSWPSQSLYYGIESPQIEHYFVFDRFLWFRNPSLCFSHLCDQSDIHLKIMADVLIMVLDQLNSLAFQQLEQNVRLVWGVKKEVGKLTGNLQAIRVVLLDAEKRQVKEEAVRHWVDKLKEVSFDIDDVLDEWNTAILRLELGEKNGASAFFVKRVCFFIPFSWFPCIKIHQVSLRHESAS